MPYRYRDEMAIADVAFEAWGDSPEEMFVSASDALMNVQVEDLSSIENKVEKIIETESEDMDMLLFSFLQELIFFKDAEKLLLRVSSVSIALRDGKYVLRAQAWGEELDPDKHELDVDVKAVTLHKFVVARTHRGWESFVILDI